MSNSKMIQWTPPGQHPRGPQHRSRFGPSATGFHPRQAIQGAGSKWLHWQPQMNAKTPPPWSPDLQWDYPFRRYAKDLLVWAASTDVPLAQQGPSAMLQLQGGARTLVDQMQLTQLQNGENADWGDGAGTILHPGIHCMLRALASRFSELEIETILRSLLEFFGFRRAPGEDIDACLTRFDITHKSAADHAAVALSPSVLAFVLLRALNVSPLRWPVLFMPWGGAFPTTDGHISALKSSLRQQAHMLEPHPTGFMSIGRNINNTQVYHTDADGVDQYDVPGTYYDDLTFFSPPLLLLSL